MSTCADFTDGCPTGKTAKDGATQCAATGCTEQVCCEAEAAVKSWKADETEGQLRMFVVMVLVDLIQSRYQKKISLKKEKLHGVLKD